MSDHPKRQAPAFQFYADDFIAGTVDMSPSDVGAYIRLLCYQWSRGSAPALPEKMQRVAGCIVSDDVIAKFPFCADGNRRNPRLEKVREASDAFRKKQAEKAGKRWGHNAAALPRQSCGNANGHAEPMPEAMPEACSPSPSPSPYTKNTTKETDPWELEFGIMVPERLRTENCLASLKTWLAYKKERREGYKRIGLQAMLTKIANEYTPADLPKAIEASIAAGWKGIYAGLNFGKPVQTETKGELLQKIQANRGWPNHPDHANATDEEKAAHITMSAKYKAMA